MQQTENQTSEPKQHFTQKVSGLIIATLILKIIINKAFHGIQSTMRTFTVVTHVEIRTNALHKYATGYNA